MATLHGQGHGADFREHCVDVAREMLLISGRASDPAAAAGRPGDPLRWLCLAKSSASSWLRRAATSRPWTSRNDCRARDRPAHGLAGYIAQVDAREVGYTVVDLGGGRKRARKTPWILRLGWCWPGTEGVRPAGGRRPAYLWVHGE